MSTTVTDIYSDYDLQDPAEYYGGFKEGRVIKWGEAERALSDPTTGEWRGAQFSFTISDFDRKLRKQFVSEAGRYWRHALSVYMTNRANRALLGQAYPVFVGPIVGAKPTRPLAWEITLSDVVSQGLLSDETLLPWRLIGDGFLLELSTVSESLDLTAPEPIIYGEHRRTVDVDPASPQGFAYTPIYLGTETITAQEWHVWMIAGHACADVAEVLVDGESVLADEGAEWLIPHHSGHDTIFGASYQDRRSAAFGNDRRYTLLYGLVTDIEAADEDLTLPDAAALGRKTLTVCVNGIEPTGDGSGDVITDRFEQYKHFAINFIANQGPASYQTGAWLANPTWSTFDLAVPIIEEGSFDACGAIAAERLPAAIGADYAAGYIGAAIIGSRPGTRASVRKWIADWNRSCGCQQGITHLGQYRVTLLHPTTLIKAAAPLYTDAYEVLADSFDVALGYAEQANRIPFVTDYHHETATWKTQSIATADESIVGYAREISGAPREYPFAPGITMAWHLARLAVLTTKHPPITVVLEATVGPTADDQSLGYLDLGDYVRYQHFAGPGEDGAIRLAQVVRHQVLAGSRRVRIEVRDCEDLIGFDAFVSGAPGDGGSDEATENTTCATAIEIVAHPYTVTLDTTANPTDPAVSGLFLPFGEGYHAAWWHFVYPTDGTVEFATQGSLYDTKLGVWGGGCGALAIVDFNDNDGILNTSRSVLTGTAGDEYWYLVAGFGPDDSGALTVTLTFTPA